MLCNLVIHNIVLIEALNVPFKPGLCVITGETGAGKSILLDALGLVLGRRAEARLVRHGQEKGSVVAEFDIANNEAAVVLLEEHDVTVEDTLLLKRVITSDGKSKAYVNDIPVSQGLLQQLAVHLVEVHGQHDQKGLLSPVQHRPILDAYGRLEQDVVQVNEAYNAWKNASKAYKVLQQQLKAGKEEEEYLQHVLEELTRLSPEEGEEELLAEQRFQMMHREKILETLQEAYHVLAGKQHVGQAIHTAERILHRSTAPAGDLFEGVLSALDRAGIEVEEAIHSIEATVNNLELDTNSLESIEERLFSLREAARKYQRPVEALAAYREEIAQQLTQLEHQDEALKQLQEAMEKNRIQYINYSEQLSEKRKQYAGKLSKEMQRELAPLKMDQAKFEVSVTPLEEEKWNAYGQDDIQFLVSANPGHPVAALHKIASGGELSRFMLALKVVLSGVSLVPTLIFDEIDTGIGGATADAVGQRLGLLGKTCQVLCVTHQPQVASYGSHHLKIEKNEAEGSVCTSVQVLDEDKRKEEIARMLAGSAITDEARAAANKLIEAG